MSVDRWCSEMSRLKRIHINMHRIKSNRKSGAREPVITVKDYQSNTYGNQVIIKDASGEEVARVVYSPDKPLSCGATVWIETRNDIHVDQRVGDG